MPEPPKKLAKYYKKPVKYYVDCDLLPGDGYLACKAVDLTDSEGGLMETTPSGLDVDDIDSDDLGLDAPDINDLGFTLLNEKKHTKKIIRVKVEENKSIYFILYGEISEENAVRVVSHILEENNTKKTLVIKSSELKSDIVSTNFNDITATTFYTNLTNDSFKKIYVCHVNEQLDSFTVNVKKFDGYVCDQCQIVFCREINFLNHKRVHHSIACTLCDPPRRFRDLNALWMHNDAYHSGKKICDLCYPARAFDNDRALSNHKIKYHSGEKICTQCRPNKRFVNAQALVEHKSKCHRVGKKICTQCRPNKRFVNDQALANHEELYHSGEKICDQCDSEKTFINGVALARHKKRYHSGEKICDLCHPDKPFKNYAAWAYHTSKYHGGSKKIRDLDNSSVMLEITEESSDHNAEQHGINPMSLDNKGDAIDSGGQCSDIDYGDIFSVTSKNKNNDKFIKMTVEEGGVIYFVFSGGIKNEMAIKVVSHLFSELSEDSTSQTFVVKPSDLESASISTHSNDIKVLDRGEEILTHFNCIYVCNIDFNSEGMSLTGKNEAINFTVTLARSNGHPCEQCDKVFLTRISLRCHKNIKHTEEKTCPDCNNKFANASALLTHKSKYHKGKAICSVCQLEFQNKTALYYHKSKEHTEKQTCPYCDKQLAHAQALANHKRRCPKMPIGCPKVRVSCPDCDKLISNERALSTHKSDYHSGEKNCPHCNKVLPHRKALRNHIKKEHSEK